MTKKVQALPVGRQGNMDLEKRLIEIVARGRSESATYQYEQLKQLFKEMVEELIPEYSGPVEQTLNYDAKGERVRSMDIRYTEKQKGYNQAIDQIKQKAKEKLG